MATTLREIVYSIKENLKLYSDDADVSLEYIAFLVKNGRAMLLAQKFSNRSYIIPQKLRQHFYKTLELSKENEFVDGIGTILRTSDPIVNPLEPFNFKSNLRINSGSYTDINFTLVSADRFPFVGQNKWVANHIYVTIGSDFRLYFTSNNPAVKLLENVKLSYVTEDPEAAYPETIYYNAAVDYWDAPYHIEEDMITILTDLIVKKLSGMINQPEDKINDSTDSQS